MKVVHLSKLLSLVVCLAVILSLAPIQPAQAVSTSIVISQVYGGGGNSGATYKNDFIELYNLGSSAVDVTGWTVQYASAAGVTWAMTPLTGTIQPGKYFLVQEAAGAGGTTNLPTPDATGSLALAGAAGKVALVNNSTALSSTPPCPTSSTIVDFVGFGTTASCYEGTGPTPAPSNTTAVLRKNNGAQDTDNNANDFTAGAPFPRNSGYPLVAVGLATPNTLFAGDATVLTVAVTSYTVPPSAGLTVTCNLSAIGGSATQAFYDDGTTGGDVTAGDNTFTFSTSVAAATGPGAKSLACTVTDDLSRTTSSTINLSVLSIIPIGQVNGAVADTADGTTHVSPYAGQIVTVQGVIYEKTLQAIANSTNTYKGFFIQNTAATADTDPNTSDGLFVFMSSNSTLSGQSSAYTPTVGDEVVVTGTISEYYNMTELTATVLSKPVVRSNVVLDTEVAATVANPGVNADDANRYWERHQSMRMMVPANSLVVSGRNVFSPADAEIWLVRPDSTVAARTNPFARRAFRDASIMDDNYNPTTWDGNGYRMLIGSLGIKAAAGDGQALLDPGRSFDTISASLVGGLNYTFSKYRIEVTDQPTYTEGVDPSTNNPPQSFAPRSSFYSIADYNLENLYDFRDNPFSGCDFVGNTGCPNAGTPFLSPVGTPFDYVPASDAAYQARLTDIAKQIINDLHSPDVLMVQEVENQDICTQASLGAPITCGTTDNADGKPDVLQDLSYKIYALGGPAYSSAFDRNSSDLRGIAPAFMYRTDRVDLVNPTGDPVLGMDPAIGYAGATVPHNLAVSNPKTLNAVLPATFNVAKDACETSWVFPRAPDVALFRIYASTSKTGESRDVYVIDNHFKSGPDTCVNHRTEQANYNAALVSYIQAQVPGANVVTGGDLNVYPHPDNNSVNAADQLGALYNPSVGLKNLVEVLNAQAPGSAYSYVYLGMAQTLDQMFINAPLLASLQSFRVAHINSDFPADYPGDVARGTSDHDPNVATFAFGTPTAANLVNFTASLALTGGIQINWTTVDDSLTHGFNLYRGLSAIDPNPVKVNEDLIPAHASGSNSYSFQDVTALPNVTYYYTLEQVSTAPSFNNWGMLNYQYLKGYFPIIRN